MSAPFAVEAVAKASQVVSIRQTCLTLSEADSVHARFVEWFPEDRFMVRIVELEQQEARAA